MHDMRTSRLPGFYTLPASERIKISAELSGLNRAEQDALGNFGALNQELVETFIENAVGTFGLPLGIATNFLVNGRDVLIPMAVEETSVLAAASHGAKLARSGGGFRTTSSEPIMTGQIQLQLNAPYDYDQVLNSCKLRLLDYANKGQQRLLSRGGGVKDISWYFIPEISSLVVNLHIHTCDAMGANIVNTICERVSFLIAELFPQSTLGLRILTNLSDRRMASASCVVKSEALAGKRLSGNEVVSRIVRAWQFAEYDTYRAATHNKGVMNGIDPVLIATGNDWRAIEAGAHAYCVRDGRYRPMTRWEQNAEGDLVGFIELPMAVGTVGGVTKLHPTAQAALKLLGSPSARELAEIVCAVGLAQNLSALRALGAEGIQEGHMALHQRNLSLMNEERSHAAFAAMATAESRL